MKIKNKVMFSHVLNPQDIANMPKYGYSEILSKSVSVTPQRHCGFIVPKFCLASQAVQEISTSISAMQTRLYSLYEGMTRQNKVLPNMSGGSYRPRVNPLTIISQVVVNLKTQNCKEAIIMPNQINSTNTPKKYDAGDMHDIQSLAECDMYWMYTTLEQVRHGIIKLKKTLQEQCNVHECYFDELETLSSMYSYLAEERHAHHADMAKQYEQEWENTKGGEV